MTCGLSMLGAFEAMFWLCLGIFKRLKKGDESADNLLDKEETEDLEDEKVIKTEVFFYIKTKSNFK